MEKKITCRKIDGTTVEVLASELSFRPSVYGVAIQDGKVLLSPQFGDGYDFTCQRRARTFRNGS